MFSRTKTAKDKVRFNKTHADTDGELSELEMEVYSGEGPPLHYHKVISQTFKVKEGTLYLTVSGKTHTLKGGDTFMVPPLVPHGESAVKGKLLRCVVEIRPGHKGYEDFINMTYGNFKAEASEEEQKRIYLNADTYRP